MSIAAAGFAASSAALAQGESTGENFSAKPAPALFASDCTGAGCHSGPQGLAKGKSLGGLAGFLRAHYTNSRESAAALAAYLLQVPGGGPQARPPREAARPHRPPAEVRASRPPHRGAAAPVAEPQAESQARPQAGPQHPRLAQQACRGPAAARAAADPP